MDLNQISSEIIRAAIGVHKELGPGLLENVYQVCMVMELQHMGRKVQGEVSFPIFYRDQIVQEEGFRIDLLVEDQIIYRIKISGKGSRGS